MADEYGRDPRYTGKTGPREAATALGGNPAPKPEPPPPANPIRSSTQG
jgi:hypothetical protein